MHLQTTDLANRLRVAGLRPTRQRLALATILFGAGDRHISAESLHREAHAARINVSLATVYNTLNQFKAAGLLREVAFEGDRTFFDTNTSNHFHYYLEDTEQLMDIGATALEVKGLPHLPAGTEIDRIDIIVRLRKTPSTS
jgi:Fur family iron response transcriptional regulator